MATQLISLNCNVENGIDNTAGIIIKLTFNDKAINFDNLLKGKMWPYKFYEILV